jgi:hypothetical protein
LVNKIYKKIMNDNLFETCFSNLQDSQEWGYSIKRIRVTIPGTVTDYISCSGYGYKDEKKRLYVEIRLWIDQGDCTYNMLYNPNKLIVNHFAELIRQHHDKYNIQMFS